MKVEIQQKRSERSRGLSRLVSIESDNHPGKKYQSSELSMAVVTRYHHQIHVFRLTVRDEKWGWKKREEKRSGVNRLLSSPTMLGHEYLSLLLFFLLQHHLSLPLSVSVTLKVDFVCCEVMADCHLKTRVHSKIFVLWSVKSCSFVLPLLFFSFFLNFFLINSSEARLELMENWITDCFFNAVHSIWQKGVH